MFRMDQCRRAAQRVAALGLLMAAVLPQLAFAQPAGIDPQAAKLLRASTDYVGGLKRFSIETRNTFEVVLKSGQKIQFDHGVNVAVQRPNKLRAQRTGDLVDQDFYYDGKSLTLHSPSEKYFATVAAPGAYETVMEGVTDGLVVGKGVVEGVRCDHLAFRAPHIDWQIWIQEGDKPLPRKIVITTKDVANAPQFAVVMTKWNLAPKFSDSLFAFKQPKDAKKVEFQPVEGGAPKAP